MYVDKNMVEQSSTEPYLGVDPRSSFFLLYYGWQQGLENRVDSSLDRETKKSSFNIY